jgi:hypothetical protein
MKLRAQREGLAIPVTVVTANLPKDTLVKLTADNTVDKADANSHPIGRLVVPSRTANGPGTVETHFKEKVEIKTTAIVAFGSLVKIGVPDGTTGENTVTNWVSGTDGFERVYGVCCKAAASGGVAEVLTF